MDLYLIRHGDAVPLGTDGITDDAARPLTDRGQEQSRRLGGQFARLGIVLDVILTSPLVRARETTVGLLPGLPDPKPAVEEYEEIGGKMRPRRIARHLRELGKARVAIVGHQPTLGEFLAWMIGSKKAQLEFAKGGAAHLNVEVPEKGGATLHWLVTPEWYSV